MTSNIDEQVRQAMRAAVGGIEPPVQELVDGGLAYGRKLRRRHRMIVAGTGLVAVAAVAAGVVVAPQLTAGQQDVAAPEVDTSGPVVEANPANPGVSDDGEARADVEPISSEDVLETLIELLPPGEITDSRAMTQDVVGGMRENPAAIVTFDDGEGAANVSITLNDFPTGGGCKHPSPNVQCTEKILDDGSKLWITQRLTYTDGRQPQLIEWWAALERPDGLQIDLRQNNAVGEKDVPATRSEPPLTVEQMEAIVTSDRWDVYQVGPERQIEISGLRESLTAANRRLAAALGDSWAPPEVTELVYPPRAVPAPGNAAKLPTGYTYVLMRRDVIPGRPGVILNEACSGLTEMGVEMDSCVDATTPSGEPIHLQWSRSVDHSQSVPHDELSVIYENEDGDVVRVMLSVSDDPDLSTPERRAEIVAWIEQQIDAMIAAATADDATTR
ncbi:MAG TPA: hypothetical protein VFZ72_02150 [Jiangellaceae bacterium]